MRIHKEGYASILLTLIVLAALNLAVRLLHPGYAWSVFIWVSSAVLLVFIISFFRVPSRKLLQDSGGIIAPADGKIVVIEEVEETEYFKDKRIQISIFMSPANIHLNRNPISGSVLLSRYHAGKYLVAWHPKSSTENERHTIVLKGSQGIILVRQIAGAMARRIVNYLKEGDQVLQNEEMGFIKFGSRVDVFVPIQATVAVKLNQAVRGGQTLLAIIAESSGASGTS